MRLKGAHGGREMERMVKFILSTIQNTNSRVVFKPKNAVATGGRLSCSRSGGRQAARGREWLLVLLQRKACPQELGSGSAGSVLFTLCSAAA